MPSPLNRGDRGHLLGGSESPARVRDRHWIRPHSLSRQGHHPVGIWRDALMSRFDAITGVVSTDRCNMT
jgi:hypothetical protein